MHQKLIAASLGYKIQHKTLIEDITLQFDSGLLHGILGPNGSGKSTLMKTLSGIWQPTSGEVYWNEQLLLKQDRHLISRTVSLVPQNPLPHFDFLVEDIVAMGRYPYDTHYWKAADGCFVEHSLLIVDALHLRNRRVNQLSYGERQRVYIARALVTESPVLLLDEPTASLDIRHQLEIWQILQNFVKNGKIVIVTTHDLAIAERFCDRISILNQGRCIGTAPFSDLMTKNILKEVFGVSEIRMHHSKQYALQ